MFAGTMSTMYEFVKFFWPLMLTITCFYFDVLWLAATVIFLAAAWHREVCWAAFRTLPRDVHAISILFRVKADIAARMRENVPLTTIFSRDIVPMRPDKTALIDVDSGRKYTFAETDLRINQVANYFTNFGLKEGDVVALYMMNSPEYVILWLGLSKIGVCTAWINYNLRKEPLSHCVNIAKCKAAIVDEELLPAWQEAADAGLFKLSMSVFAQRLNPDKPVANLLPGAVDMHPELDKADKGRPRTPKNADFKSELSYVYTSGTTGLPKAAIIRQLRFYYMTRGLKHAVGLTSDDVMYITLPLYHSQGGIVGIGQMFLTGCTCVIRRKFSASQFWSDCIKYNCTASQYVGELCRFLLAQPAKPIDDQHRVRLMFGNGLRPQLWRQFVRRFHVSRIGELYGSTEGNANIVNTDNKEGAVGFLPVYTFLRSVYPIGLVRADEHTGEILRGRDGLCIPCQLGETGIMIGRIKKGDALSDFSGYLSSGDTNKKLVRHVYNKGDVGFHSGDLLKMDQLGYLYFSDRLGDTFRWKGENVSTMEVEGQVMRAAALGDVIVYGVVVPGNEGRAGMAAIVDEHNELDLSSLYAKIKDSLPAYARPVFLRVCKEVESTGTFKLKKTNLQKDAFDPSVCTRNGDTLYYLNAKNGAYEPLTNEIYDGIVNGKVRL